MRSFLFLLWLLSCPSPAMAERLVSLAPSLSEILVELGAADQVVAVLGRGSQPAALAHAQSLGRHGQLNLEQLLLLRPDLILMSEDSMSDAQRQQLQQMGLDYLVSKPRELSELAEQFAVIGERIGRGQQGRQLQQQFLQGMAQLQQHYGREVPIRVFYQVWDEPMYTLGGTQIVSRALEVCGARNIFADLSMPAPQVSMESVLSRDPEVILVGRGWQRQRWQAWLDERQVLEVPDDGLERPSFQMLAATEKLCRLLAGARQ